MLTKLTTLAAVLLLPGLAMGQALSDRVPADAMVYVGWEGAENLGPAYQKSHLKGFLDDSQFLELFNQFLPKLMQKLGQMNPDAAPMADMASAIAQPMWKHRTAFFVSHVDFNGNSVTPHLGIIVEAGDDANALKDKLDQLANMAGGAPFPVKVLQEGKLVGILVGYDEPKNALAGTGGNMKALGDNDTFKDSLAEVGKEPAAVVYVDIQAVLNQVEIAMAKTNAPEPDRRQFAQVRDALGLGQLKQLIATSGFDGQDWGSQLFLAAPAPRSGLLSLLEDKPLSDDVLRAIPKGSTMAGAGRLDLSRLLSAIRQTAGRLDPQAVRELNNALSQLKQNSGVDLEKDIFDTLGDQWAYFTDPALGGRGILGLTVVNRLKDAGHFEESMVKLQEFVADQVNQNMGPSPMQMKVQFHEFKTGGMTVHYLGVPFVQPSWAVHDGTLYVGLFPQMVVAAANNAGHDGQSILQNEGFVALRQRLGGKNVSSIEFLDLPKTAPDAYALWLLVTRLSGFGDMMGVQAPPMVMPTLDKLIANLAPAGQAMWVDSKGLHVRAFEPFPGSELLASDPSLMATSSFLTAVMLPALNRAREQANRVKSMSNLRQIGMASLMYSNAHNGKLPETLGALAKEEDLTPGVFVNPTGNTAPPAKLDANDLPGWVNQNSNYTWIGAGRNLSSIQNPAEHVLAYETLEQTQGNLVAVLFADGHVEEMSKGDAQKQILKSMQPEAPKGTP